MYWIVNWSELHESLRTNAVRDASTSQVASHYFGTKNSNKGITLEEMFRMMYKNNFSEPALPSSKIMMSSNEVLIEDQKFLHILEKGTVKKDVHYVVPLPFWDENLVMPNNRIQALRRLKCFKRFLRDKSFPQNYPKITNLIAGTMIKLHMLVGA